jgi:AraC family transcriptional regulator
LAVIERTSAEGLARHIPGRLLADSRRLACQDVLIELLTRPDVQESLVIPAVSEPLIVWVLSGAASVEEREIGGTWSQHAVSVGDFFLTNAAAPYELRWHSTGPDAFKVMHLYMGLPIIERAAIEMLGKGRGSITFRDISGRSDPVLSALLQQMQSEITTARTPSALFVNGLAQSLAAHMVRTYRDSAGPKSLRGVLPAGRLNRVVELMEAQRSRPFQLLSLAQEAGMSAFHFSRLFKASTGLAPSQYFIRLRMSEARRLLRETERSVIEIGLDVGYESPSHFAQVFRRQVGISPSEYRRS